MACCTGWKDWRLAGIGMLAGFGIYFVLHLLHAMGAGDVKFMAAVGSLVGWRWWFHIFFASVMVGAIAGVILAFPKDVCNGRSATSATSSPRSRISAHPM